MRAGRLRHQIELLKPVQSNSTYGEKILAYESQGTVWAAIEDQAGHQQEQAQQLQHENTAKILLRYRTDVAVNWRIAYGNRYLEVIAVNNPDQRNIELQLVCRWINER